MAVYVDKMQVAFIKPRGWRYPTYCHMLADSEMVQIRKRLEANV
jgi:hypothetical protein